MSKKDPRGHPGDEAIKKVFGEALRLQLHFTS